jgi:hypothetical protein
MLSKKKILDNIKLKWKISIFCFDLFHSIFPYFFLTPTKSK